MAHALAVPFISQVLFSGYAENLAMTQTTVSTIVYEGHSENAMEASRLNFGANNSLASALDWLALSKVALPNARSMTPGERISVNEFFWSHFK